MSCIITKPLCHKRLANPLSTSLTDAEKTLIGLLLLIKCEQLVMELAASESGRFFTQELLSLVRQVLIQGGGVSTIAF